MTIEAAPESPSRDLGQDMSDFLVKLKELSGYSLSRMASDLDTSTFTIQQYLKGVKDVEGESLDRIKSIFELSETDVQYLTQGLAYVSGGYPPEVYDNPLCIVPSSNMDWRRKGSCVGASTDLMFPEDRSKEQDAKQVCRGCKVANYCLEYAIKYGLEGGVWGNTTEVERVRIVKRRQSLGTYVREEEIFF